ncbi:MAG: alpha/beta hydrolase [archaeon]
MKKKVIYVTGFKLWDMKKVGRLESYLFKLYLKERFEVIAFDYANGLNDSLEKYAVELKKFIDNLNLKKGEKVNLIGHSAGGLIGEYYVRFLDDNKVDKLVTISSPFQGAPLARWFFTWRKGIKDIQKGSKFLKKISKNKKKLNEINFYCTWDILVPGSSGKGSNPSRTYFFIHFINYLWPPIVWRVKRFFESNL